MKKNLVTGITVSGELTIANYLVVIKQLQKLDKDYNIFLFIADLHAITTRHDPQALKTLKAKTAAMYMACNAPGSIFVQSEVKGHTELAFLLSCHTKIGELSRMTQFKEKRNSADTSFGLMSYPVLMAADILLYQADVIVGPDQKQHLELTQTLAQRCNSKFGEIFRLPQLVSPLSEHNRVRDLQEPTKKMSKSTLNKNGVVYLSDDAATIRRKFQSAVTDSENQISFDFVKKPGVSNLILIYALTKDLSVVAATKELQTQCDNYLLLKQTVAQAVIDDLAPIQEKMKLFTAQPIFAQSRLSEGRRNAQFIADQQLKRLEALGFSFSI